MENRYQDFYEGTTHKKLKHILDVVIYTLRPHGDFDDLISDCMKITKNITWDKFESIEMNWLATFLESTVHTLINSQSDINNESFKKIQQIIEPLEIVITEIKMAHVE